MLSKTKPFATAKNVKKPTHVGRRHIFMAVQFLIRVSLLLNYLRSCLYQFCISYEFFCYKRYIYSTSMYKIAINDFCDGEKSLISYIFLQYTFLRFCIILPCISKQQHGEPKKSKRQKCPNIQVSSTKDQCS